jgi:hypothetical protein
MANAGYVNLKQVDRSLLVELRESNGSADTVLSNPPAEAMPDEVPAETAPAEPVSLVPSAAPPLVLPSVSPQYEEAVRVMQEMFVSAKSLPKWPMYIRNVKQFFRSINPEFDERRFGFSTLIDFVRHGQKAGIFRVERNRQGILRVFPGPGLRSAAVPEPVDEPAVVEPNVESASAAVEEAIQEPETLIEEGPAVQVAAASISAVETPKRRRRTLSAAPRRKPTRSRTKKKAEEPEEAPPE